MPARWICASLLSLLLIACGGGGDGSPQPGSGTNNPPTTDNPPSSGDNPDPTPTPPTSGDGDGDSGGNDGGSGGDDPGTPPSVDPPPSSGGGSGDGDNGTPAPGPLTEIRFTNPRDIAADANGNLYVADGDYHRNRLRQIAPDGSITTLVSEEDHTLTALAVTPEGQVFYSSAGDPTSGRGFIWRITNGSPVQVTSEILAISEMVFYPGSGNLYVGVWTPDGPEVKEVRQDGSVTTLFSIAETSGAPASMTMHEGSLWLGWRDGPYEWKFFRWSREAGLAEVSLDIAYSGGMASTDSGIYIANYRSSKFPSTPFCTVELLNPDTRELTRVAGGEGESCIFDFGFASSFTIGSDGNLYMNQYFTHTILRVTPEGEVATYAGAPNEPDSAQ